MAWWHDNAWRMIQTNLREVDMVDISAKQVVEDLKAFKANVLLLNAAGIIANYPTQIPNHPINPFLTGDSLKDIVDLCHEHQIKVIARTDFSKVDEHIYEQHPEWAFRTAVGGIMNYNGKVQMCINGGYQQDYVFDIIKELFEAIPFDGLFCNMGGFQTKDYDFKDYGFCHCDNCRKLFKQQYQMDLPMVANNSDPAYGKYLKFQETIIRAYRKKIVDTLKAISDEICFDDEDYARIEAATEYQRKLPHWQYHASSNCRVIVGDGHKPIICSNTSVDYIGFAFRHISVSPSLQALRLWQNIVNLGALDYYIIGRIDNRLDRSAFDKIRGVFHFHSTHEDHYMGLKSKATVLLKRADRWVITPEEKGWVRTLTESHIPFAECLPTDFLMIDLSRYELLILADSQFLTKAEGLKIDAYVRDGGQVIATGYTGLYDDATGYRGCQMLKCLGVQAVHALSSHMVSSMVLLSEADKEWLSSQQDTDVLPVGDDFVYNTFEQGVDHFFRLVEPHKYGPPEKCYFTEVSDRPGMIRHAYGKGRAYYIPWLPGTFYANEGHSHPYDFMQALVLNVCGQTPIAHNLTPMVEVSWSEKENGDQMVQCVNTSGCFGLSFFEPIPVYDIGITLPAKYPPKSVYTLRSETVLPFDYQSGQLAFAIPVLEDYEGVVIVY